MKVLFVTSALPPGRLGGAETYAIQLAEKLAALGVTVDIMGCNPTGRSQRTEQHGHGARILIGSPVHPFFGFLTSAARWLSAHAGSYDAVQFFDMNHLTAVGLWATRKSGRCRIARVEGVLEWSDEQLRLTRAPLLAGWSERQLMLADRYVVVSRSEEQVLVGRGVDPQDITFLPNGIDVASHPATPVPAEPIVVCPARLRPEKNHLELLEAFERVVANVPDAHLVLPGDGPMLDAIRLAIRERGLENSVSLPGHVEDMTALLTSCRLTVLLSLAEGPALGVLEGAACGRPAVVTRVGGLVDSVLDGVTGSVVELHDIDGAAEELIRLLTDDALCASFGEAAARFVREDRSIDIVSEQYLEYLTMCAEAYRALRR